MINNRVSVYLLASTLSTPFYFLGFIPGRNLGAGLGGLPLGAPAPGIILGAPAPGIIGVDGAPPMGGILGATFPLGNFGLALFTGNAIINSFFYKFKRPSGITIIIIFVY
jgi:hypothetical protein